jgi:hypothetical protein
MLFVGAAVVCAASCATVVSGDVEGESGADLVCLVPGARPLRAHPVPTTCPTTCLDIGTACGSVDLGCGEVAECGCGNPMMTCQAGSCECTAAPGDVPCEACPGKVPRYCGEMNPKTQQGCTASGSEVDGNRIWCCDD